MKYAVKTMEAVADLELPCDRTRASAVDRIADRCEVVTDFHRLEELSSDWRRLWESDRRAEIFQTPEWARAWWRVFGSQCRLRCVVVFAGDEVVGFLPLVERDHVIRFLGAPEADYGDVICEERRAREVLTLAFQTLLDSVDGWKECEFHHLSRHSRMVRFAGALPRGIRSHLHRILADRQYTIILRKDREEIFKSLLGKNHTKRLQNKLKKAGQLRFRHLDPAHEADAYLDEFFRHHVRRHAAIGRRSACGSPEFCQFVREVIRELGPTGLVRFGVLELDGKPLAWELAFQVNGKFLLYQHTFDLDASHYTPGEVLLWNALDYARENVSREFDFGSGDELYKDRFSNYSRETYSLFLTPRGGKGMARGANRELRRVAQPALSKLKEIAKSRRMTLRAFRALRMWLLSAKGGARQAKQDGALLPFAFAQAKKLFGDVIWSRMATDVYTQANPGSVNAGNTGAELEIRPWQFGELVDLSWEHPEILSLNALQECRKRMKEGDQVYVVRDGSGVVCVCWASKRPENPGSGEVNSTSPALEIEQVWSARSHDLAPVYSGLLSMLAREAAKRKLDLMVHCSSAQFGLRLELERQKFRPGFRRVENKFFGHFRSQSVTAAGSDPR